MKALLSILLACTLSACGPNQTRDEITGTQSERVTRATAILSKYCKLPGPLLDAHMAEDIRDNSSGWSIPGPSNVSLSGVITFPPQISPSGRRFSLQKQATWTPPAMAATAQPPPGGPQ